MVNLKDTMKAQKSVDVHELFLYLKVVSLEQTKVPMKGDERD